MRRVDVRAALRKLLLRLWSVKVLLRLSYREKKDIYINSGEPQKGSGEPSKDEFFRWDWCEQWQPTILRLMAALLITCSNWKLIYLEEFKTDFFTGWIYPTLSMNEYQHHFHHLTPGWKCKYKLNFKKDQKQIFSVDSLKYNSAVVLFYTPENLSFCSLKFQISDLQTSPQPSTLNMEQETMQTSDTRGCENKQLMSLFVVSL